MLKFTDNLDAVAEAVRNGDISAEEVHTYLAPRLEYLPETEVRRLLNEMELAVYTLPEPGRQARVLEILGEASRLAASYRRADEDDA